MHVYTRHNEVPILEHRSTTADATHYNHVQIALNRLGPSIRFRIPKLKHLDLILQRDAWVVVDRALNDIPVLAWTEFQAGHRQNLHEPIHCELRIWHTAATMVLTHTLDAMEVLLGEELEDDLIIEGNILTFPSPRN